MEYNWSKTSMKTNKIITIALALIFAVQGTASAQRGSAAKGLWKIAVGKGIYDLATGRYKTIVTPPIKSFEVAPTSSFNPTPTPSVTASGTGSLNPLRPLMEPVMDSKYLTLPNTNQSLHPLSLPPINLLAEGKSYYYRGDMNMAQYFFERYVKENPSDPEGNYYYARCLYPSYLGLNYAKKADQVLPLDRKLRAKTLLLMGAYNLIFGNTDTAAALAYYKRGIERSKSLVSNPMYSKSDPDLLELYVASCRTRAIMYLEMDSLSKAKEDFGRISEVYDLKEQLNFTLAILNSEDPLTKTSIKLYSILSDIHYPPIAHLAAIAYVENNDPMNAVKLFDWLLDEVGTDSISFGSEVPWPIYLEPAQSSIDTIRWWAAELCMEKGAVDSALMFFNTVPDSILDTTGLYAALFLNTCKGNYSKAVKICNRLISIDPSVDNIANRAWCYEKLGEHDSSLAEYSKVLNMESTNSATWNTVYAYWAMGDLKKAKKMTKYILKKKDVNFYDFMSAASFYEEIGDLSRAKECIRKAFNKEHDPYYYPLLEIYFESDVLRQEFKNLEKKS